MYVISEFCHLCFNQECNVMDITENDIINKLTFCMGHMAIERPVFICAECQSELEKFYDFRTRALKSTIILNNYLVQSHKDDHSYHSLHFDLSQLKLDLKKFVLIRNTNSKEAIKINIANLSHQNQIADNTNIKNLRINQENYDNVNERNLPSELSISNSDFPEKKLHNVEDFDENNLLIPKFEFVSTDESQSLDLPKSSIKRKIDDNPKCYECELCNKIFVRKGNLTQHVTLYHSNINLFKCKQCGKKFKRTTDLRNHLLYVHVKVKNYICNLCEKRFTDVNDLKTHMLIHIDEKLYECSECDVQFRQEQNWKQHMLIEHKNEKPHACTKCQEKFHFDLELQTHMHIHLDDSTYKCTICDRVFKRKSNLDVHLNVHKEKE